MFYKQNIGDIADTSVQVDLTAHDVGLMRTQKDAGPGGRVSTWKDRQYSYLIATFAVVQTWADSTRCTCEILPQQLRPFFSLGYGDGNIQDGNGNSFTANRGFLSNERGFEQDPQTRFAIGSLSILPGTPQPVYAAADVARLGITNPNLVAGLTGQLTTSQGLPLQLNDVSGTLIPPEFCRGSIWRHDVLWNALRGTCDLEYLRGGGGRGGRKLGLSRFFQSGNFDPYVFSQGMGAEAKYDLPEGILWDLPTTNDGRISFQLNVNAVVQQTFQTVTGGIHDGTPLVPIRINLPLTLVATGCRMNSGDFLND